MDYSQFTKPKAWFYGLLCLALFLIMACGSAQEGPAASPSEGAASSQSVSEVAGISAEKAPAPMAQREPAAP